MEVYQRRSPYDKRQSDATNFMRWWGSENVVALLDRLIVEVWLIGLDWIGLDWFGWDRDVM